MACALDFELFDTDLTLDLPDAKRFKFDPYINDETEILGRDYMIRNEMLNLISKGGIDAAEVVDKLNEGTLEYDELRNLICVSSAYTFTAYVDEMRPDIMKLDIFISLCKHPNFNINKFFEHRSVSGVFAQYLYHLVGTDIVHVHALKTLFDIMTNKGVNDNILSIISNRIKACTDTPIDDLYQITTAAHVIHFVTFGVDDFNKESNLDVLRTRVHSLRLHIQKLFRSPVLIGDCDIGEITFQVSYFEKILTRSKMKSLFREPRMFNTGLFQYIDEELRIAFDMLDFTKVNMDVFQRNLKETEERLIEFVNESTIIKKDDVNTRIKQCFTRRKTYLNCLNHIKASYTNKMTDLHKFLIGNKYVADPPTLLETMTFLTFRLDVEALPIAKVYELDERNYFLRSFIEPIVATDKELALKKFSRKWVDYAYRVIHITDEFRQVYLKLEERMYKHKVAFVPSEGGLVRYEEVKGDSAFNHKDAVITTKIMNEERRIRVLGEYMPMSSQDMKKTINISLFEVRIFIQALIKDIDSSNIMDLLSSIGVQVNDTEKNIEAYTVSFAKFLYQNLYFFADKLAMRTLIGLIVSRNLKLGLKKLTAIGSLDYFFRMPLLKEDPVSPCMILGIYCYRRLKCYYYCVNELRSKTTCTIIHPNVERVMHVLDTKCVIPCNSTHPLTPCALKDLYMNHNADPWNTVNHLYTFKMSDSYPHVNLPHFDKIRSILSEDTTCCQFCQENLIRMIYILDIIDNL